MISKNQIKAIHQLELKKYRQREGLFVAEGPKGVGDLLRHGFQPKQLFATDEWDYSSFNQNDIGQSQQNVTEEELRKISFLQHPQQVLATFPIPSSEFPTIPNALSLALDGVQDPGNLGTIIRIADWFGIETIFCSHETADAYNPKVVQATMGSIARVHIYYVNLQELLAHTPLPVYGTLLDGNDIYQQELTTEGIIVMGNEGNGISTPIRQLINNKLLIPPFRQGAESLNVAIATAITCSEFRRRSFAASVTAHI
jgi:TrmH family RNA methyltransferase